MQQSTDRIRATIHPTIARARLDALMEGARLASSRT